VLNVPVCLDFGEPVVASLEDILDTYNLLYNAVGYNKHLEMASYLTCAELVVALCLVFGELLKSLDECLTKELPTCWYQISMNERDVSVTVDTGVAPECNPITLRDADLLATKLTLGFSEEYIYHMKMYTIINHEGVDMAQKGDAIEN
jgi:hypothetical protein